MIQSKEELKEYIEYESHGFSNKFPDSVIGEPQNFQKLLRKTEYYRNCRKDIFGKIVYLCYRAKLERESQRLGLEIPCNVFGKGLRIVHYGSVTVNKGCKVGKNCRIYNNTVLGTAGAGAVVVHDVPDNVTVAGIPARIIKEKGWTYTT